MSLLENVGVNDLSHLEDVSVASNFIADVKEKIVKMRQLELAVIEAEAQYKERKREYENYKATVVVPSFTNAGIENIQDDNGNFVRLESKYYCNPNKNAEDRKIINQWLLDNGGDHLLKREGKVSTEQFEKLKEAGIPFDENIDVNTNSLKSHLLDLLGYKKGSIAKIALDDIPECMHFVVDQEVVAG